MADSFRAEGGREPLLDDLRHPDAGVDRPSAGGVVYQIPSDSELSAKLHEVEDARALAEARRQYYRQARQDWARSDGNPTAWKRLADAALGYARDVDVAEEVTNEYEEMVAERWRADLEREAQEK